MRHAFALLCALALGGCATSSGLQPNVIIEQTSHSGGSALGVDPASQRAVSGGWEGMIHVWNLADGKALGRWRAHDQTVHGAVFLATCRATALRNRAPDRRSPRSTSPPTSRVSSPATPTAPCAGGPHRGSSRSGRCACTRARRSSPSRCIPRAR